MKQKNKTVSIVEAIETLSSIAEMDFDKEVGISADDAFDFDEETIRFKTIHWLNGDEKQESVRRIKETFKVILEYLRDFYETKFIHGKEAPAIENIKTVMVLVGDAAKKLDKYSDLFSKSQESVMQLKEFKDLQRFYKAHISQKVDEAQLGKWILGLTLTHLADVKQPQEVPESKYIFVDLESVKKDSDYELFYLKKEDGTRFFNPRLIRNMKLVADFGGNYLDAKGEDPLKPIASWRNRQAREMAKSILAFGGKELEANISRVPKDKKNPSSQAVKSLLLALMMASKELPENSPKTNCDYFLDYQKYLKELTERERAKRDPLIAEILLTLIQGFFQGNQDFENQPAIEGLLHAAYLERNAKDDPLFHSKLLSEDLKIHYDALKKMLTRRPPQMITHLLEEMEGESSLSYQPLSQGNFPAKLFSLVHGNGSHRALRLPTPIHQEYIHQAALVEEFVLFLQKLKNEHAPHLYIQLQDRYSWKDAARTASLERTAEDPAWRSTLSVATLPIESNFYHQIDMKPELRKSNLFIDQFVDYLTASDEVYFSPALKEVITPSFIRQLISSLHQLFLSGKNTLTKEERLKLIDLSYLFLQLKLIEAAKARTFNLSCKDAVDGGPAATLLLYVLIKFLSSPDLKGEDAKLVHSLLFGPPLFVRERVMLQEKFERTLSTLKLLEDIRNEYGPAKFGAVIKQLLAPLYPGGILNAHPSIDI